MSRVFNGGYQITQAYKGSAHTGIDVCPTGGDRTVTAHSAGTVVSSATGYGNMQDSSGTLSYGNYVKIRHATGCYTLYAHLEYAAVRTGASVGRGQALGTMGNSGNSYGSHLHFEYRTASDSCADPTPYLNGDLPGIAGGGSASGSSAQSGGETAKETKDITKTVVKSVEGASAVRKEHHLNDTKVYQAGVEILIQNGSKIQAAVVQDELTLDWTRKGAPGALKFKCLKTQGLNFQEGNPVSLRLNGKNIFLGYVFEKSRQEENLITVTAYDQLRYFKNKDTYMYQNKKYSDVLRMIARDYGLKTGEIADTKYVMKERIEETTLFDICANASDETVLNQGVLYVLYDDFGKLCLQNIESMKLPILIDADTASGYDYKSGIDKDSYSKIKLVRDNSETGEREIYEHNNVALQKSWGILQYYENLDATGTVLKEKAKLLGEYYGKKRRELKIKGAFGDIRVRGGSSLVIMLGLGDTNVQNYMVVEKVTHTFSNGLHKMDLDLTGIRGEFVV